MAEEEAPPPPSSLVIAPEEEARTLQQRVEEGTGKMDGRSWGRSAAMLLLLVLSFVSLLAALEVRCCVSFVFCVHAVQQTTCVQPTDLNVIWFICTVVQYKSGGRATQSLLSCLSLGGGRDDEGIEERLLMISGGSGGNSKGAADERAMATRQGEGTYHALACCSPLLCMCAVCCSSHSACPHPCF